MNHKSKICREICPCKSMEERKACRAKGACREYEEALAERSALDGEEEE